MIKKRTDDSARQDCQKDSKVRGDYETSKGMARSIHHVILLTTKTSPCGRRGERTDGSKNIKNESYTTLNFKTIVFTIVQLQMY